MWEAVPQISTGFALAAFLGAIALWALKSKLSRTRDMIQTASEADRAKLVANALEFFAIDTSRLTREQQHGLAVKQITARETRFKWSAIVFTIIALLGAAVVVTAITRHKGADPIPPAPGKDEARLDDIEISDIGFLQYDGDARAPRLDIKLTNRGTRSAFVKSVRVEIKKVWSLEPLPQLVGAVVPPSHDYVLKIAAKKGPSTYVLPVSHGLKPDDHDRFTVQIEEHPWPGSNSIYWLGAQVVANANDIVYSSKDLFCVITQFGDGIPDEAWIERMAQIAREHQQPFDSVSVREAIRNNKRMVLDVSEQSGVKSPALIGMIESAKLSDIK